MTRQGHGTYLNYYDFEFTPFFALRADPRFCYCLFIPNDYQEDGEKKYRLLVLIHGTERGAWKYRERFADFADRHGAIILAPLFPCNTFADNDFDNYKFIESHDVRYDLVLLQMVDEVKNKYRLRQEGFYLFGFSGGGHFSHRFFYIHPERLAGISIGAPGMVTLADDSYDFWVGVGNLEERFGKRPDYTAMKNVPVQMVVGDQDRETWEIDITDDDELWMTGAELSAGLNRIERLQLLQGSFVQRGIAVDFTIVPGVAHNTVGVIPAVQEFFTGLLEN